MFHTQLLEVINSGQAWAFVGSGPSTEAGAPSWGRLVEIILEANPSVAETLSNEPAFVRAQAGNNFPRCLSLLEDQIGREALEEHVRSSLDEVREPGPIHKLIADLPFKGYITTNYDHLLERALDISPGWISAGNSPDQCRLLSGDPDHVVWHIHGSAYLADGRSELVLTEKDYDKFYLEESPLLRQLSSLLAQRRVVAIGFGFADSEVMRLLRRVGRMTTPDRPIFGFLPKRGDFSTTTARRVFLHQHNIDSVAYKIRRGGHGALRDVLETYAALSLRRSLRYRGVRVSPPSYDPETTGLLVYNELVLSRGQVLPNELRERLLASRILAVLATRGPITLADLEEEVQQLATVLGHRIHGALAAEQAAPRIEEALHTLVTDGHIYQDNHRYHLTSSGEEWLSGHAGEASRLEEQFRSSLSVRARDLCGPDLAEAAERVAVTAEKFVKDLIERRALGVAMALTLKQPAQQDYHLLALLSSLSDLLQTLEDEQEGRCLVSVVEGILRAPTTAERRFIGVALQARFGLHLLGYDDDTLTARLVDMQSTAFFIDSTSLIALLARSSEGSDTASRFLSELKQCGVAGVFTTKLLTRELTEHLQWAMDRVREGGGSFQSLPVFEAATGRAGQRSNAFIEGFANELAEGTGAESFNQYLEQILVSSVDTRRRLTQDQIQRALRIHEIEVTSLRDLAPNDDALRKRAEEYQARLQALRESAETFTRDRQVEAEAEALILVEGLRNQSLQVSSREFSNAYFVSNTRIIDDVAQADVPITMRPEAALQWLITLRPCAVEDLATLTSGLMWELQERDANLVNTETLLTAFGPFIDASATELEAERARLRKLTGNIFAGNADLLSATPDRLDLPVFLESLHAQRAQQLEHELAEQKARAEAAERAAGLSQQEREELDRLRRKDAGRSRYRRRQERQASELPRRRRRGGR